MTDNIKSFLEENIELLDQNDFVELYKQANRSFWSNSEDLNGLTRTLHAADIYPEYFLDELPSNYINLEDDFEVYMDQHEALFKYLVTKKGNHKVLRLARNYALKKEATETYNIENPPVFIYNKSTAALYPYAKSYVTEVIIDNKITVIPDFTFANSSKLNKVTLNNKLTTIGKGAFYECRTLKEITIPDSVKTIYPSAFELCISLERIQFSKNMSIIMDLTCNGCSNLKQVIIPEGITRIDRSAFTGCVNLTSIDFPDSLTRIGAGAFRGVPLNHIDLNNVEMLGDLVFENNRQLTSIDFGSNCQAIGTRAFARCPELRNVTLPSTINYMGRDVFNDGNKFLTVKYYKPSPDSNWAKNWNNGIKSEVLL